MTRPRRPSPLSKLLLVEGLDDCFVLAYLMEANGVAWPAQTPPVWIENRNSVSALLERPAFAAFAKEPGLEAIGLVVDADADAQQTWARVVGCCIGEFPGLPATLAPGGCTQVRADGLRFGAWVMPDNRSPGMIETLLTQLVRPAEAPLLQFADDCCREASTRGASFKMPLHFDKARLHTFLAWQDPPGHQLHEAVFSQVIDGQSVVAASFVTWFRTLFQV